MQTLKVTQDWSRAKNGPQSTQTLAPSLPQPYPPFLTVQTSLVRGEFGVLSLFFFKIDFDVLRLRETSNFNQFFKIANFIHPRSSYTNRGAD